MHEFILQICLLLCMTFVANGQNDYVTKYLWSTNNVPLYSSPNLDSRTNLIVKSGAKLKIIEVADVVGFDTIAGNSSIGKRGIELPTEWVKVELNDTVVFMKNTYLLDIETPGTRNLDTFIREMSIRKDTIGQNTQCSKPDITFYCLHGISYSTRCRSLYGEIEINFKNWSLRESWVFLDYFEGFSERLKEGKKLFIVDSKQHTLELTDNMYSYILNKNEDGIQVIIIWSC